MEKVTATDTESVPRTEKAPASITVTPDWSAVPAPVETPPSAPGKEERQYHLDALRSVLMILGVFLHASYLYATGESWLVKDGDGSRALLWVNHAIHFFRIPCFFILSGFFSLMLLRKQGRGPFLRTRMQRLGLPLLSTAILLNTIQAYFLHSEHTRTRGWMAYLGSEHYAGFWKSGEWIGHLWFLVDILIYTLAAAAIWTASKSLKRRAMRAWPGLWPRLPALYRMLADRGRFLLLLPMAHLLIFAAAAFLPPLYRLWGGLSGYSLLHFFPYYLFGMILFLDRGLRDEFHRLRTWKVVSIPLAFGLGAFLNGRFGAKWSEAAVFYIHSYLVWSCCALSFTAFRFLLNRKIRLFTYLSEASYSIYLFHHAAVVAFGLFLSRKHWNVFLEFGLVVGLSLLISVAAHHFLVLRVRPLRMLFMGR